VYKRQAQAKYFAADGASLEPPEYQLYAPTGAIGAAITILRNRGIADLATEDSGLFRNLEYLADLTVADARFPAGRLMPGMGNSGNGIQSIWGQATSAFADDANRSAWLAGMFLQASGGSFPTMANHAQLIPRFWLPDLKPVPINRGSRLIPSYGMVFRDQWGTADETALLLRTGVNNGHWDTDTGNVILYGRGAPLSPGTGYQYYAGVCSQEQGIYHNRCKVVRRDLPEIFGRVDTGVINHAVGERVDYAVADRLYPRELFPDQPALKDGMHWRRHVVFLKGGGAYAVMRDTFPGGADQQKWWTWLNLDLPSRIAVGGKSFADIEPEKRLTESAMQTLSGQELELSTAQGASTWMWFDRPASFRVPYVLRYPATLGNAPEVKTAVEASAAAGEDFTYVVWPRTDGTSAPRCTRLAAGVLKIDSAISRDYVVVGDQSASWSGEDVVLEGIAAAVRVGKDSVTLSILAGCLLYTSPSPRDH
jgi:hypothetical protein